ncbi:MAG: methylated-DNA--protein-cysteine methyltransferase [Ramlibacter sp.]|uniref:methylated-DNA--[protein]-cysteine S-methyltransferase n=1 Tax=Ramlibacter sp. TaxID=1917967 RepID=UPI00261AEF94|nr:methylated-DNA--[protein]-cysteine S-methyltransferase [Ramlibacter sp.]MDB5751282.1 methylated-DNA--protein-cysteine methyltransferase [Ramlibacter sp.]
MRSALGHCLFETAVGECGLAWNEAALVAVQLPEATPAGTRARLCRPFGTVPEAAPPPFVQAAIMRIRRLLQGERDDLRDLPLALGTVPAFHQRVYEAARAIPPGEVVTYGELARRIGDRGGSRAVGQALGHNPFAPVVPCHRILAAGGRAGGFSAEGGAATKLRLLEIEQARFDGEPGLFD